MDTLYNTKKNEVVKKNTEEILDKTNELSTKEETIATVKATILLVATIIFLIIAFDTSDTIKSHLFTSLAIITASFTFYNLSHPKQIKK